ncbi:hypothetical protein CANINC_003561 [Pichia inconspicua]|uniref:Flavoprotein domain-containing protein n=1 Tax=Pichia inconspicua TaxID=52247 RepID=A0A4T0WYA5_9ASCO|nr:hypothetical protein CANINC_003561 [[Candida] inconspicua]
MQATPSDHVGDATERDTSSTNVSLQHQSAVPIRPIFKKTTSSSSSISATNKLSQLPQLETRIQDQQQLQQQQPRKTINVNESLLETVKIGTNTVSGGSMHTPQPQIPASILSGIATPITPTPVTPQLKSSTSTVSFQVQQQKHRGSISVRPAATKQDGLTARQTSNPLIGSAGSNTLITSTTTSPKSGGSIHTPNNTSPGIINPITSTAMMNTTTNFSAASISRKENLRSPPVYHELISAVSPKLQFTEEVSESRKSSINFSNNELSRASSTNSATSSKKKTNTTKTLVTPLVGPPVPFTQYLSKEDDDKIHILIGATGSVATIKILMIIDKLFKIYGTDKVSIQLVVTRAAEHFLRGMKISTEVKIWREQEEWSAPMNKIKPGDPILHVELRKWADILLIAPLSANTLAKIANGLADNLLTSIVRVWNPAVPILVAPAMNTFMYKNPVTKMHLEILREDFKYIEVLRPVEKVLVCGDIGMGGMREWSEVVDITVKKLKEVQKLKEQMAKDAARKLEGEGDMDGKGDDRRVKGERDDDEEGEGDENEDDDEDDEDDEEDDEDEDEEDDEDDDEDEEDEEDDEDDEDDEEEDDDEEEEEEEEEEEDDDNQKDI